MVYTFNKFEVLFSFWTAFGIGFFKYAQKCQLWHFRLHYMKTKKTSNKMLPPVGIEPRP